MGIDSVKSQNIAQYISILSNPDFLNAVKSATKGDNKSDSLLKNLDKLKNILSDTNSDSSLIETSSGESLSLLKSIMANNEASTASSKSEIGSYTDTSSAEQEVQSILASVEMLESMLNLDMVDPNDELVDLFKKFREIITKLDQESRKLHQEVKDKEIKSELKLTPSSNTKSGFQEGLTLVAQ